MNIMTPYIDQTYALMRIVVGLLFFFHGSAKLISWPQPPPAEAPMAIVIIAGGLEFVGGPLIAMGAFTRLTAFLCSGLMAVGYWLAHGTKHLFPIVNGGELAALYCFVFLFISAYGPGIWSIDRSRGILE